MLLLNIVTLQFISLSTSSLPHSFQVSEDVEPGTTFYTLAAQDPDVAGEGALVFGAEPPVSAVNSDGRLVEGPQLEELAVSGLSGILTILAGDLNCGEKKTQGESGHFTSYH